MWEITVKNQLISFLCAVVVGIFLSFFFDFFRTLRQSFKHKKITVFIEDILFFLVATFITFLLLMARCNGEVRAYVIVSIVLGFFFYRITLSRLLLPVAVFLLKFFIKIFNKIGSIIGKSVSLIVKNAKKLLKIRNRDKKTLER